MLVLTRRAGDALYIDGDIRVVVLGVNGGQVRIGIEAPPECNVLRGELHERIARANRAAATAAGPGAPRLESGAPLAREPVAGAAGGVNERVAPQDLETVDPAEQPGGVSL